MRGQPTALALLALAFLGVGCSPARSGAGQQQIVFAIASGFRQGGPAVRSEILDIGLPALMNISAHTVRLAHISLADTSGNVRLRSVTAFRYRADGGLGLDTGDMTKCKGAQPLTAVVTPAHAQSGWYVAIAVTFTKPGPAHIGRARIDYMTNGHHGWQYQNLDTTVSVLPKWPKHVKRVPSDPCP